MTTVTQLSATVRFPNGTEHCAIMVRKVCIMLLFSPFENDYVMTCQLSLNVVFVDYAPFCGLCLKLFEFHLIYIILYYNQAVHYVAVSVIYATLSFMVHLNPRILKIF